MSAPPTAGGNVVVVETAVKNRVHTINKQLADEFYPAVKGVGQAGQQLVRAHQCRLLTLPTLYH